MSAFVWLLVSVQFPALVNSAQLDVASVKNRRTVEGLAQTADEMYHSVAGGNIKI